MIEGKVWGRIKELEKELEELQGNDNIRERYTEKDMIERVKQEMEALIEGFGECGPDIYLAGIHINKCGTGTSHVAFMSDIITNFLAKEYQMDWREIWLMFADDLEWMAQDIRKNLGPEEEDVKEIDEFIKEKDW